MLKKIFTFKNLIIILAFGLVVAIATSGYNFLAKYNKRSFTMTLNYSGSEKGLNPDGSRFNLYEIKSNEILEETLKRLPEVNLTVNKLQSRIDLDTKMPTTVIDKVKTAINSGQDYRYVPTEFTISYSQENKFTTNYTVELLTTLSEVYKEYFFENYSEKDYVLDFEPLNTDSYDYIDLVTVYNDKVSSMLNYLSAHKKENSSFRAESTHQTFDNVIEMLKNLNSVELEKYKAYVVQNAVSKNSSLYVGKLNYLYDSQQLDYDKLYNAKQLTENSINIYDSHITGTMFIPVLDINKDFYMNKTKTGLDYLSDDAYDHGVKAADIKKSMDDKEYQLDIFAEHSEPEDGTVKYANSMIETLNTRLTEVAKIAKETDSEYLSYKTKDYISFNLPEKESITSYFSVTFAAKYGAIGCAAGFIIILISIFLKEKFGFLKGNTVPYVGNKAGGKKLLRFFRQKDNKNSEKPLSNAPPGKEKVKRNKLKLHKNSDEKEEK